MVRLANFSGQDVIVILTKHFHFQKISQKGSHVKLRTEQQGKRVTVIVPDHKELSPGTVRGVLNQAGVSVEQFLSSQ